MTKSVSTLPFLRKSSSLAALLCCCCSFVRSGLTYIFFCLLLAVLQRLLGCLNSLSLTSVLSSLTQRIFAFRLFLFAPIWNALDTSSGCSVRLTPVSPSALTLLISCCFLSVGLVWSYDFLHPQPSGGAQGYQPE